MLSSDKSSAVIRSSRIRSIATIDTYPTTLTNSSEEPKAPTTVITHTKTIRTYGPEGSTPMRGQDTKGARRMPWHRKSTKDAASCDKPRGAAHTLRSGGLRMGEPTQGHAWVLPPERIGRSGTTGGTETSKYPEEEKSTEIAPVAASERAPAQTHASASPRAFPRGGCGLPVPGPGTWGDVRNRAGSGTAWEGRPQRVRAPYANPPRHPAAVPEYRRTRETRREAGGTTLQG